VGIARYRRYPYPTIFTGYQFILFWIDCPADDICYIHIVLDYDQRDAGAEPEALDEFGFAQCLHLSSDFPTVIN